MHNLVRSNFRRIFSEKSLYFNNRKTIRLNTSTSPIIAKTRMRNSVHTSLTSTDSSAISAKIRRDSSLINCLRADLTSIEDCTSLETKIESRTRIVTSSTLINTIIQLIPALYFIQIKDNGIYCTCIWELCKKKKNLTIVHESGRERGKFPARLKLDAAFAKIWRVEIRFEGPRFYIYVIWINEPAFRPCQLKN